MSTFVVVVGIALIVLVLSIHYAQAHQERKVWHEFAQDDFKAMALQRPLTANAVANAEHVKADLDAKSERHRELSVVRIEDESPDCRSFYFASPNQTPLPTFFGGQYLLISLPDPDSPNRQVSRCYSLSDGVHESTYRITVKRVPGGKMSNLLHDTVRIGDRIRVQLPSGRFHIGNQSHIDEAGRPQPLNLIAAGIGITPMMSMLRESLKNTPDRAVRLFYQLRDASNAPFLDELRQLAVTEAGRFRLFVAFSKPGVGDLVRGDLQGRMDAVAILGAAGSATGNFMICGPDEFMRGIAAGLTSRGVPKSRVEYESFMAAAKPKPSVPSESRSITDLELSSGNLAVATQATVRFSKTACDAVWTDDDSSLLDIADRYGVTIESACRSGQCGSCVVRLLAGRVRYAETPDFDAMEPHEALACVARPAGDIVIDA